jgi:hypothetical protein
LILIAYKSAIHEKYGLLKQRSWSTGPECQSEEVNSGDKTSETQPSTNVNPNKSTPATRPARHNHQQNARLEHRSTKTYAPAAIVIFIFVNYTCSSQPKFQCQEGTRPTTRHFEFHAFVQDGSMTLNSCHCAPKAGCFLSCLLAFHGRLVQKILPSRSISKIQTIIYKTLFLVRLHVSESRVFLPSVLSSLFCPRRRRRSCCPFCSRNGF